MDAARRVIFQIIIDSLNGSSDDEAVESDEAEMVIRELLNRRVRVPRIHCTNYIENVVHHYSDCEFKSHFRLSSDTFMFLLELLEPQLSKREHGPGRGTISPEKTLPLALWMLATPNSYRCVSDRFGTSKSVSWRSVHKVVDALYAHRHAFIVWPDGQRAEETWNHLKDKFKFPKVIGAIYGTDVKIAAPKLFPEAYIKRKGYHSIHLQIVCDHDLRIIHAYCGEVGSVHDMRVFKRSGIDNMCTPDNFPEDSHLLGDAAYKIQKYVMVPFRDNGYLTDAQVDYNYRLSETRMIVERAIGMLKVRFRSLLDTLPIRRTDLIPKYIIACCIVHNICQLRNDVIDMPILARQNVDEERRFDNIPELLHQQGIEKRNAIVYYLQNQNGF